MQGWVLLQGGGLGRERVDLGCEDSFASGRQIAEADRQHRAHCQL
jgi:hypothetical protein